MLIAIFFKYQFFVGHETDGVNFRALGYMHNYNHQDIATNVKWRSSHEQRSDVTFA